MSKRVSGFFTALFLAGFSRTRGGKVSVPESGKSPFSAKTAEVCCSCHQDPGRKKENQNRHLFSNWNRNSKGINT